MPWSLGARTGLELPMVSPRPSVTEPGSAHRLPVLPKPFPHGGQTLQYDYTRTGKPSAPDCVFSPPWEGSEEMWVPHRKPQPALSFCIHNFPLPHAAIFMPAPHHMLRPHEHRSRTEPRPALRLLCPNENPTEFLKNGLGPAFTQLGIPYGITGFHLHLLMIYWELWI